MLSVGWRQRRAIYLFKDVTEAGLALRRRTIVTQGTLPHVTIKAKADNRITLNTEPCLYALQENPVQSVFRKYIQNTLKSFFGGEPDDLPSDGLVSSDAELSLRFPPSPSTPAPPVSSTATETATATAPAKKHRSSLTGLSKYGPWGYLFLGMLICGGALLICGLWGTYHAQCKRQRQRRSGLWLLLVCRWIVAHGFSLGSRLLTP